MSTNSHATAIKFISGEHFTDEASAVFEHISNCEDYLNSLLHYNMEERPKVTGRLRDRNDRLKRKRELLYYNLDLQFLINHFKTLASNLKFNDRKTFEAMEIKKYNSNIKLNRQNDFVRTLKLI